LLRKKKAGVARPLGWNGGNVKQEGDSNYNIIFMDSFLLLPSTLLDLYKSFNIPLSFVAKQDSFG
jgi:hypothetical protein